MSIYLDNSATTKIRAEALEKYIEVSNKNWGNPSSLHGMGLAAEKVLSEARKTILSTLGEKSSEVIFTASGSEANNLAIFGRAYAKERFKGRAEIITTEGEHASVSSPISKLEAEGYKIKRIPTKGGKVDMHDLEDALSDKVVLVSLMMVNNETGALYDIAEISALVKRLAPDALLHVDATQSYLKLPFTKKSIGADMITISSHKIEGPKGVGALIVDSAVIRSKGLSAQILGGGQEGGLRSGTENVPGIAAFAEAARLGYLQLNETFLRLSALRERLISTIREHDALGEVSITEPYRSAPHILNITLPRIKSETMLHFLSSEEIFISSGSACSSNSSHKSSALVAFGRSEAEADSSIRISLGRANTEADVERFCEVLAIGIKKLARINR